MKTSIFILLLLPVFCFSQTKDLVIDSAQQARKDSLYAVRQAELSAIRQQRLDSIADAKAYADSVKADSIAFVRFQKDSIHNKTQDSIRNAHLLGFKHDSVPAPVYPVTQVIPIDSIDSSQAIILNVTYAGDSIHVECVNCYIITKQDQLEIHYEKPKQ